MLLHRSTSYRTAGTPESRVAPPPVLSSYLQVLIGRSAAGEPRGPPHQRV